MAFSVGILYSVQEFLKFVKKTPIKTSDFISLFNRFEATSSSSVLEIAENCNWIKIDIDSNVKVTSKGDEVVSENNMRDALRIQLKHLIGDIKPSWSYLIDRGRKEAFQYFPLDVQQCFKEAELINSYEADVVKWWDKFASVTRGKQQDTQLETGREGERLSLEFERNRTGKEPIWQSIDSNLAGYDILSVIDENNDTPLRIEVKTSTVRSNEFTFYISRNEWSIAEASPNYIFHFWVLGIEPDLYILDKNDIKPSIPLNQGNGIWENAKVQIDIDTLVSKNKKVE
ncbi:DUF3883 domain-containing protein [Bacillus paralicheniformis]|uniref:DUF3883 domain-containing protein n=1 Tax=Bacillus paralicheniformis TaxID=1648923 RepID=UPI002E240377|nr:DUF3883 domain-containing protein [Bacillus paralicheniformis]